MLKESPSPHMTKPFEKVLIANRAEIACRVIRACKAQGIRTVAVYSAADETAQHVQMADEAVSIGPAPVRESYLCVDKIIKAAQQTGAQAIHPGYGFLSENPDFARACQDAGIVFIGPPAEAIEAMGSKTAARKHMQAAGVPVVPGANGPADQGLADLQSASAAAEEMGYPVMIKAAAGGGGRGMRLVPSADKLEAAWAAAKREAQGSFGNDTLYLEKAISNARHIEVQIVADQFGNVVHLFERDCSIQRRHQKVIEECLSPAIDSATREKMGAVAIAAAKAVRYVSAGTVEMLYDADSKAFYFLEMNTRLQVEHPVTELVTGVDLVAWQLAIAAGATLPMAQEQIRPHGAAIECRVYAEDPVRFLPSPGTISKLVVPTGPGIRNDGGFRAGDKITVYYDPLIAKLCAHGNTRSEAIARMKTALASYSIEGIKTNLAFHKRVMDHPAFIQGEYDTSFIERHKPDLVS